MERKFNLQLFAVKASNQVDVLDITDGYSVILTCESYTFLGDTDSVNGTQSINVTVRALRGAEEIACEIGNITCPTGLSAVSNGQSVAPVVTITATSALTTSGSIIIPVIIGEVTINKTFSWSIAFKGTDGTSVTILDSEIVYQASSSGTTPPTGNWSSTPIAGNPGQYVWTRTTVEYSDGKTTVAYAVSRNGVNGADGVDGADGADGTSVIITNQEIRYQASNSGTTPPTGTWSANPVTGNPGQFVWTRTVVTYSDGTSTTSYSVSRNGNDGSDAINLVVTSSNGLIFKNTSIATTLTAHIYQGGVEVTGSALNALGTIKWYKDGATTAMATGQTLTITAGDVTDKATYVAQLED